MVDIKRELAQKEFLNRENMVRHNPYNKEVAFFQSIQAGDKAMMNRLFTPLCSSAGYGKLSNNPIRNLKYHLVVSIAFITRYCIEGGLEEEKAYNMSDIYIQKLDTCATEESIHDLHKEVVDEFTKVMHEVKNKNLYSKPIVKCIDYIYSNLHNKISLDELAEEAQLSVGYLSKLFHSEVGITVSQYIVNKKIDAAKNLLISTEYTTIDIANYLNFSTESYFINVFKKYTGLTPKRFRSLYYRNKFSSEIVLEKQ